MRPLPPALAWLLALAAAAAATGACLLLDGRMSVAGLAMVYLVAVVCTALALPRGPAVLASLACVSALNFFFVPPRHSFEVDGAEYWWTLSVLLALSLGLGALIAGLRERRARAERATARTGELLALSETLAACLDHEQMAQEAARWLSQTLGLPCAIFLREGEDGLRCHGWPQQQAFEAGAARWALDNGRGAGRGFDDWPDLPLWCAPFQRTGALGAVQLLWTGSAPPDAQRRQHWLALARQAGLCIERAHAARTARDALASARAESARNTLLAALSHDLRTPLAGILGSASALRTQGGALRPAARERLLQALENDARDVTAMADNILQMARLAQPQQALRLQWESAEEILGEAAARMRRRWPHARIELRVAPGLPPLQAEAALLAQLLANLVDNAVRHGGEAPRIVLTAGRSRGGLFLAVRDHGRGLPPGDPQALFQGFGHRRPEGSSGLGLALCRLIVQAHGGSIVARRCAPGAEFRIDLPVPQAAQALAP